MIQAADEILNSEDDSDVECGKVYKERVATERGTRVFEKTIHGKYFREIEDVFCPKMFQWVTSGYVSKNTEGLIFAAQEQALQANWLKARISGKKEEDRCRKCKKEAETVSHLVSGCSELAQMEYKRRHDRKGLKVYWELCRRHKIKCSGKWYEESPDDVRTSECGNFEIWWDRPVETPKKLDHNRPDVILIDKNRKHWTIIDFSVPNDRNILTKEKEKVDHYSPLAFEVRKMRKVTTEIIPLVIGALGAVTVNLEKNLKRLEIPHAFCAMQVSAVLGTSIILRKVLSV